jgi:hypothetical protein
LSIISDGDFVNVTATRLLCLPDCANSSRVKINPGWRCDLSDHGEIVYSTADGMDYPAHENTYSMFIKMGTYGGAAVIFVVAMMAVFLT